MAMVVEMAAAVVVVGGGGWVVVRMWWSAHEQRRAVGGSVRQNLCYDQRRGHWLVCAATLGRRGGANMAIEGIVLGREGGLTGQNGLT